MQNQDKTFLISFKRSFVVLSILYILTSIAYAQSSSGSTIYTPSDFNLVTGNTYDFMELIPQLEVSEEGVISIVGSGEARVKIDDRLASPSGDYQSILNQINVNLIDYIDIKISTSARNDAEAEGGIVNIVTLGDGLEGTSGNIYTKVATGEKGDIGAGVNMIKDRWNVQLNANTSQYKTQTTNKIYTENYYNNDTTFTRQRIVNTPLIKRFNTNASVNYQIDNYNDVELTAAYGSRKINVDTDIKSESNNESGNYAYINRRKDIGQNHRMGLAYSGLLSKDAEKQKKLDIQTSYFYSATGDFRNIQMVFNDFTDTDFLLTDLQADYKVDLNGGKQIETGFRSYIRHSGMNYNRDSLDSEGSSTPIVEDDFRFKENVQAGYFQWFGSGNKLDYILGMRAEHTQLNAEQRLILQSFHQHHTYLFPSVQFTYNLKENHKLQLNYNRTIRRQRINQMNPFINDANPKNIHFGNPDLKPSLTGNYLVKYEGKADINSGTDNDNRSHNWSLSLIFRNRNDHIYRASLASEAHEGVIENSFYNLKSRYDVNIEGMLSSYLFSWWKFDLIPSFRQLYQDGTNINPEIKETSRFLQLRLNSNINLWTNARLVVNSFYRSGYDSPQGNIESFGRTNFTLHQNLFDNKLSVIIMAKDPFGQSQAYSHLAQENFIQDREFSFEQNIYEITLRFNFGKLSIAAPSGNRNILNELQP